MNEILKHIDIWFQRFRPELNSEEKKESVQTAYNEIYSSVELHPLPTKIILVNQYLYQNHYHSAYIFVKEVFKKFLPVDYETFLNTPIFYDLNEGILEDSVKMGLFPHKGAAIGCEKFEDQNLQAAVLKIIREHIS